MRKFIDKETMVISAGAGIGVIQTVVMKEYVDATAGPMPVIGDILPAPWGNWSTAGNIIIGGAAFGLSYFTNFIRNPDLNLFLKTYGITSFIGGLMNGIFPATVPAARFGLNQRPMAGNGYFTQSYYPNKTGMFYRRPQSRAQGFASDVTQNPMAAIPTTIPYNKIDF